MFLRRAAEGEEKKEGARHGLSRNFLPENARPDTADLSTSGTIVVIVIVIVINRRRRRRSGGSNKATRSTSEFSVKDFYDVPKDNYILRNYYRHYRELLLCAANGFLNFSDFSPIHRKVYFDSFSVRN